MIEIDKKSSIFYIFNHRKDNSLILRLSFRFLGRYWFLKRNYSGLEDLYIDLKTASRREVDFFPARAI